MGGTVGTSRKNISLCKFKDPDILLLKTLVKILKKTGVIQDLTSINKI